MGFKTDNLEVTGTVKLGSDTLTVSGAELNFVDGVTSAIQTQLNDKAPSASPTFSGTVSLPSTTSIGNVSATEIGYVDGVTSAIQTQLDSKANIATIDGYLNQGVEWNETADTYTRLGSLASFALGSSPGDANLPIHSRMRRCLVSDDMATIKYLDPTDSTKLLDGGGAAALDGSDGQVMVEIPKFYYKYEYDNTGSVVKHRWRISEVALSGYEVHPAFKKGGTEKDYCYIGAYEAALYDTSASRYGNGLYLPAHSVVFASADKSLTTGLTGGFSLLEAGDKIVISGTTSNNGTFTVATVSATKITVDEAITDETAANTVITNQRDFTATTGDKLSSVSGKSPMVQLTRANARVIATNRGAKWFQMDFDTVSAIQLLFVIEYGSFYSQSVLGAGISNVNNWPAYNNYNPIAPSGNSNVIGNASGNNAGATAAATEKAKYLSYRGIENIYGHIWGWVDGFSINSNAAYVSSNPSEFSDDSATNYTLLGTLGNSNGYARTILKNKRGFLPTSVSGGASNTGLTDYYYQNSGWRVAFIGGAAYLGAADGLWFWALDDASGGADRRIGARLACF